MGPKPGTKRASMQRLKTIAIIPARGGSKGIRKKNIQLLAGRPLLAHTIEQVRNVSSVDRVIVSTDDADIRDVALQYKAEVPFMRPAHLAGDTATTDEVLQHAVSWLEQKGFQYDAVLWCHVTLPFRKSEWLQKIISNLAENPDVDSSFIVCATHKNYWAEKDDGKMVRLLLDNSRPLYTQRQRKNLAFQEECGLGCVTRIEVVRQGKRVGLKTLPYKIYEDIATFDIHGEFDLWLANMILTQWPGKIFHD